MKTERKLAVGRRHFLQLTGVTAAAAAASPLAQQSLAAGTETGAEKRKARYRETDDVKNFYRVNRYPAPGASK